MASTSQVASMGYIGGVQLFGGAPFRATSCSLNVRQAIEHPDTIDGTVDWTLYALKGIEIEGDVAFPVLSDTSSSTSLTNIWNLAMARDLSSGELINSGTVVVTYGGGPAAYSRTFNGCKINTFELKATAGERLDGTVGIWGAGSQLAGQPGAVVIQGKTVGPVSGPPIRVLSWADLLFSGNSIGQGCQIREFTMTVNNNLSRNYTFCPASGFYPNNISTGKRHLNGTFGFQGFAPTEASADANQNNSSPTEPSLSFSTSNWSGVTFLNIVFEYQTIEAQPGVITSTTNWYAHANGGGLAYQ